MVWFLLLITVVEAIDTKPGTVPVPGKSVYIPQSNTIYTFSFSKNTQSDNKLSYIDLNQSFNTLNPPVIDISSQITNDKCPVMHFVSALPDADGASINIFGAGSSINGVYESSMTICQYNTVTNSWKQIISPMNAPLARRNAAFEFTKTNLTFIFGGSSEAITGLSASSSFYPNTWHQDVAIYDSKGQQWINTGLTYSSGPTRANATITQISDTNGQLVVLGGTVINNSSQSDMVTNNPLANMTDIVVLDPRSSRWSNIKTSGSIAPPPRKHHTTTLHPDGYTLIVIGGEFFNNTGAYLLNDVWTLDTRDMNNFVWSQPPVQGDALYRSNHTSMLIGDQIWVTAGSNLSAKAVDIQLLNVTDWTWSFAAVSNHNPSQGSSYASIGGVPGLVGIIVGVVAACLIVVAVCFGVWWCRRKRVKPFNRANKSSSSDLPIPYMQEGDDSVDETQTEHYNDKERYSHDLAAVAKQSKITSRPSMSTTASNNAVSDWTNNNAPLQINTGYSPPLQLNGNVNAISPGSGMMDRQHPQYYDENYHRGSNNNLYANHDYASAGYNTTTANQSLMANNNYNRQSNGYWDLHSSQPASDALYHHQQISSNPNFMLIPVSRQDEMGRQLASPTHNQQLQKPNEVDNPLPSPDVSTTVYTSSTGEEESRSQSENGFSRPPVDNSLSYRH